MEANGKNSVWYFEWRQKSKIIIIIIITQGSEARRIGKSDKQE